MHCCRAQLANHHMLSRLPAQIWDMFVRCSDASLGFEDRFAIFCDQVGACRAAARHNRSAALSAC